jgi:NAD(P)-dependent dehydrogenase (short-subunit alcohol dehydrogenase family)
MFNLKDRTAIVTGASGNVGKAAVHAFHKAGAKLVLIDRIAGRLEKIYGDLKESGQLFFASGDLTDAPAIDGIVQEAARHFGRIDILANIAGGFSMGTAVHETQPDLWQSMWNLNTFTVVTACRSTLPHMMKQKSGKIINVAARAALAGKAKMAPYIVSKSGVIRLTESMSDEYKDYNINVNCILPGTVDTPDNRTDMPDADHAKWVSPDAIADVLLFLASDAARAITGASVPVYGRS